MTDPDADVAALRAGVEEVRALVAADGGDLVLDRSDADGVTLRLVLDSAECRECVMPRSFLEKAARDVIGAHVPSLATVTIIDPREDAGPTPAV